MGPVTGAVQPAICPFELPRPRAILPAMQRTGSCLLCIAERRTFKFPVESPEDFMVFVHHAEQAHGLPGYLMQDTWKAPSSNPSGAWLLPGKVAVYGSDDATPWLVISAD